MSLFSSKSAPGVQPHLDEISPLAAMPGGEVHLRGAHLGNPAAATIGDTPAPLTLSRSAHAILRVPEGTISGAVKLHAHGAESNALLLNVAVPLAENLHPVSNPAVDADGNLYATFSGPRGQAVPVSIFRIDRDYQLRPFVRELMNATGLAFGKDRYLYASSRSEGTVYRISPEGAVSTYAEGLGVATGIAFDDDGNLFVGDRSGTIFKIEPATESGTTRTAQKMFVYATLEPSVAAYHLAFNDLGTLFVTGPTTSSFDCVHAIDRDGTASVYYRGLGRPQGSAFDADGNLYVAASLAGDRGIVRITPSREAKLVVSGNNIVGLCFVEDGCAAIATTNALYHVALDIEGRPLI
jgi:sugar lactone lactonase YvrE